MPRRRLLLLELAPGPPACPRIDPLIVVPLPDGRAAVALTDETPEEALAALLAVGIAVRSSRLIEA
jgi:hypothetical protein